MNVNNSSLAQINYSQIQNNSSVQAQSSFSPEMAGAREANEGNDGDSDDGAKNSLATNAKAMQQLLSKQANTIFPTSSARADLTQLLSNQQDQQSNIQSNMMKNIESAYSLSSKNYANTALSAATTGINLRA